MPPCRKPAVHPPRYGAGNGPPTQSRLRINPPSAPTEKRFSSAFFRALSRAVNYLRSGNDESGINILFIRILLLNLHPIYKCPVSNAGNRHFLLAETGRLGPFYY
ncbi:hypothetical protein EVA_05032 [gut metagenome]|uniref:Uncharacterized protein n=1 Tax=gut metagenome TaxID=749906 RepID=J9GHB4_9ZZZZ